MDSSQIKTLKKLGIDTNKPTIEIFEDLLNVAEFLYEETEKTEIERFRRELERLLQKPTN